MREVETVVLLLIAVTVLVIIARRLGQPYPVVLVFGGLALGFIPGLPPVALPPELVLLVFLPPLLYAESLSTSLRDFFRNLRSILLLATGLVIATSTAVAVAAHALLPGIPWPAAFVLGAVVAPTDAVATAAIAARLRLPPRILNLLSGESLVNDATALVAYRLALGVVLGGVFSLGRAALDFAWVSLGGIGLGLAVGWVVGQIRLRLDHDPPVENTVSLLTPFVSYLPAETLHVSGVLAVVSTGLYLGRLGPRIVSSATRLQAVALWEMVTFLINGLLFLLVGLQLRRIVGRLDGKPLLLLIGISLLISLVVIVVRMVWVFPGAYLPRLTDHWLGKKVTFPAWRQVVIVGWSGMRGGLSLAAALSIPLTVTDGGKAFPYRDDLLFITFGVIVTTLGLQGLTLPALIRFLKIEGGNETAEELHLARTASLDAALDRLDGAAQKHGAGDDVVSSLREMYLARRKTQEARHTARAEGGDMTDEAQTSLIYLRVKHELLHAEREQAVALRDSGKISDDILHILQRNLDLEETRLVTIIDDQTAEGK